LAEKPGFTASSNLALRFRPRAAHFFCLVFVIPEIDDRIEINIRPEDLRVDTFRSVAKAGKTSTKWKPLCGITHIPTNIVVGCQALALLISRS